MSISICSLFNWIVRGFVLFLVLELYEFFISNINCLSGIWFSNTFLIWVTFSFCYLYCVDFQFDVVLLTDFVFVACAFGILYM